MLASLFLEHSKGKGKWNLFKLEVINELYFIADIIFEIL